MEANEVDELKRVREEKLRQISERRTQIEELKRRRAERQAARVVNTEGMTSIEAKMAEGNAKDKVLEADLNRNVARLIAEIVYVPPCDAKPKPRGVKPKALEPDGGQKVVIERPLQELKTLADRAKDKYSLEDKSLAFEEEFSLNVVSVEAACSCAYDRGVQTELTGDEFSNLKEKMASLRDSFAVNVRTLRVLQRFARKARQTVLNKRLAETQPVAGSGTQTSGGGTQGTTAGQADADASPAGRSLGGTRRACEEATLTPDEREALEAHPDFRAFFQRTTLMVERSLGKQTWDRRDDAESLPNHEVARHLETFGGDRLTFGRPVTDVRFSPHGSGVFLASYREKAESALSDVPGCMLVWNMAMVGRPEAAFTCSSPVLTAQFHNYEPALFFGGTYSGGVVLWDARAKAGPVMRSPLCGSGHSHPIHAMQQVGTATSANLVTASNDGRVCTWSMAMLREPTRSISLRASKGSKGARFDLAPMSLAFPAKESNIMYAGGEDGTVAQAHIHGARTGVTEVYDGHDGPVTGVDFHTACQEEGRLQSMQAAQGSSGPSSPFAGLMLTSSFDWSVKLWDVKSHSTPLLSLDSFEDYVFDVRWHPLHPAVFAAVDGEGYAHLWNLNQNSEFAVARLQNPNAALRRNALNRCGWSLDGRRLATGDSEGTVAVYTLDKSIWQPRSEDVLQFKDFVGQLMPLPRRHRQAEDVVTAGGAGEGSPATSAPSRARPPTTFARQ